MWVVIISSLFWKDELVPQVWGACEFRTIVRGYCAHSQLRDMRLPTFKPHSCCAFQHECYKVLYPFSLSPITLRHWPCELCIFVFEAPLKLFPPTYSILLRPLSLTPLTSPSGSVSLEDKIWGWISRNTLRGPDQVFRGIDSPLVASPGCVGQSGVGSVGRPSRLLCSGLETCLLPAFIPFVLLGPAHKCRVFTVGAGFRSMYKSHF